MTQTTQTSLAMKLALLLDEVGRKERAGERIQFGTIRGLLGEQRVMMMPSVKHHHEAALPRLDDEPERVRTTVVLEVTLIDAESNEQISSRWIGQAIDAPEVSYEKAITNALDDFLRKTFLTMAANDEVEVANDDLALEGATAAASAARSSIRRRPHGASTLSPNVAANDQLDLLDARQRVPSEHSGAAAEQPPEAAREERDDDALPPLTESWKAANALWRALVNEVAGHEVMDAFEEALEQQHGVDSWRRISAEDIRASCKALRKRSALPSDVRRISDREEYILAQLPSIPAGSSLTRLERELYRLILEVTDEDTHEAFMALYLEKMSAATLGEVSGRAVIALCRKLRRLKGEERLAFIDRALQRQDAA